MFSPLLTPQGAGRGRSKQRDDSASDCDSDLDLRKELKPIGLYVHHREELLEHLFRSISTRKLRAMLPEPCKVNYIVLSYSQVT